MRFTIIVTSFLFCASLVCSPTAADVIHFGNGKKVDGRVIEYVDQHLRIELPDGKVIIRKITEVERIEFAQPASALEPVIDAELEKAIKEAKKLLDVPAKRPKAGIAMYLYTEDPDAVIPKNEVSFKFYTGGGYSGSKRVPLHRAFVQREYAREAGEHRIELDPGPPYKIVNKHVTVKPGEVVNLGRILLERQKYEGTASIKGVVRDTKGEPIPGVKVWAGDQVVTSDAKGRYKLEGFELEKVSIEPKAKGFRGGATRVSIRDMRVREIERNLTMFRPRRVKLVYVISAKGDNSFDGPDVEKGTVELAVDSTQTDLSRYHLSSKNFRKFAADTRLNLVFTSGELRFQSYRGPVFYQQSATGASFDKIKSMGQVDYNAQQCPPIEEGEFVLIRGFDERMAKPLAPHCVKVLVEEISLQPTDVEDK